MSSFIPRNLTEIEAITGYTFTCTCNTVFRVFSCLPINCQPFYLLQLLKFYQFDWLIEIYLQTEGQGTHHKMVSLQPMSGFSPLFFGSCQTPGKNKTKWRTNNILFPRILANFLRHLVVVQSILKRHVHY